MIMMMTTKTTTVMMMMMMMMMMTTTTAAAAAAVVVVTNFWTPRRLTLEDKFALLHVTEEGGDMVPLVVFVRSGWEFDIES
jgi:hypothetical protein